MQRRQRLTTNYQRLTTASRLQRLDLPLELLTRRPVARDHRLPRAVHRVRQDEPRRSPLLCVVANEGEALFGCLTLRSDEVVEVVAEDEEHAVARGDVIASRRLV